MIRYLSDEEYANFIDQIQANNAEGVLEFDNDFFQWSSVGSCLRGSFLLQRTKMGVDYWLDVIDKYLNITI